MSGINYKYPYGTVWLSHSSLSDFEKCPRLYYLSSVYKNPLTKRRIQVSNPYLSLGSAVHRTLEEISDLPKDKRFNSSLIDIYEEIWKNFSGKIGGFTSETQEEEFKERGRAMIKRVEDNPGPLSNYALKIKETVPSFMLSEKDLLVLCGSIDWIEVLDDGTLHLIDFKTGKNEEKGTQQLQIYKLIVQRKFNREISKLSFWYLQKYDKPTEVDVYDSDSLVQNIIDKGRKMKELRTQKEVVCPHSGCRNCKDFEKIVSGEAEYVGVDKVMGKDVYFVE